MAISMNRIHKRQEIEESLKIWMKYRPEEAYEFKLHTGFDKFEIESIRLNKKEQSE